MQITSATNDEVTPRRKLAREGAVLGNSQNHLSFRHTSVPMTDTRPACGLTVTQLLDALQERITSILFVDKSACICCPDQETDSPSARTNLPI